MNPETDEVKVKVLLETEKSYLFEEESGMKDYFPKSEVTFRSRNVITDKAVAIIPLWLLEKKGWNV